METESRNLNGRTLLSRRRLAVSWFITYVLILLLPIAASVLVFISNQRYIRQEIIRTNETQLDLTQQTIDKRFDELQRLGQQLSLNSRLARFATVRGEIRPSNRMNLYFLTQDMIGYSASNDFIDELFVYFEGTDSVVGPNKHLQNDLFYQLYIGPAGMREDTWQRLTSLQHYSNLINVNEDPASRQLLYLHNIEQIGTGSRQIFLSLVDKDEFTWATRHSPDPDTSVTLLILGAEDEVLVRQGLLDPTEEELEALLQLNEATEMELGGQDVMVSGTDSEVMDVRYIVLTPSSVYWHSYQRSLTIIAIGATASLILGLAFISLVLRRQYSPVKNMMDYLLTQDLEWGSKLNEMDYIKSSVEAVLESRNTMEDRLESQNRLMRQRVMNRLLRGDVDAEYLEQNDFPALDLVFPHEAFTVAVFYFDRYDEDLDLASFILRNVFEELVSESYPCYNTRLDSLSVFVINHPAESGGGRSIEDTLTHPLNYTAEVLREHFRLIVRAYVSLPVAGIENWAHAYHQATRALTASLALTEPPSLTFIQAEEDSETPNDSANLKLLENYLKIQDWEQASAFTNETLSEARAVRMSSEEWRYLHTQLLVTILNNVDAETRSKLLAEEPIQKMERLLYKRIDCRSFFLELLQLAERSGTQGGGRTPELIHEIDAYIDQNFADDDLNLNRLGEIFDITPTYLARVYKEARKIAVVDQLNLRRLTHAKSILLEEPDLMVAEVAERCGFTNVNTFIRVFKKYEGITPGRYRDVRTLQ